MAPRGRSVFDTTHWSVVTTAADRLSPSAAGALENLCRAYWYPLYAHIRRKGISPADAQDITQEFFCRLIAKNYLGSVDPSRGSFRSFLLASINHLLSDEWSKSRALKRGGDRKIVSLDSAEAERRFAQEPRDPVSAETSFDRQWAVTLLSRAMATLRLELQGAKLQQFDSLKRFLSELAGDGDYAAVAQLLGCDPGSVAVAVHRLRVRYREIVQAEIAQTVTTESELRSEMRHLFASVG